MGQPVRLAVAKIKRGNEADAQTVRVVEESCFGLESLVDEQAYIRKVRNEESPCGMSFR
jgi:hypothetical protein